MTQFPEITISGGPRARGRGYGEQLASEISGSIAYYRKIFNLTDSEILDLARHFRGVIESFNADYLIEMDAMAEAAQVDPLWIVALNSRTEILSHGGLRDTPHLQATECTALCFPASRTLGQTWDWGKPMEALTVCLRIEFEDGHVITTLSEAGIIGKIGMNNAGIGVCLNILKTGDKLDGLPIHIVLRGILECRTLDEARALIENNHKGKSSNALVADDKGNCLDAEFAGDELFILSPEEDVLVHTNHYRGSPINSRDDPIFNSSYARFDKTAERLNDLQGKDIAAMKDILSDRSNADYPIFRPYIPDPSVVELGTVFTIVMDLEGRKIHVRKGGDADSPFRIYKTA